MDLCFPTQRPRSPHFTTNSFNLRVHVITNESFEEHVAIDILISLGNSLQAMLKKAKEGIVSL